MLKNVLKLVHLNIRVDCIRYGRFALEFTSGLRERHKRTSDIKVKKKNNKA